MRTSTRPPGRPGRPGRIRWASFRRDDRIDYQDASRRSFDFHALRHHFVTTLAKTGTYPKQTQALARHSTIELTMDGYARLGPMEAKGALENLPPLPGAASGDKEEANPTDTVGDVQKQYRPATDALRTSSSLLFNENEQPDVDDEDQKLKREAQLAQPVADCPESSMVSLG